MTDTLTRQSLREAGKQVATYQPVGEFAHPYQVLLVCTGNICRSAYAEVIASYADIPHVGFASAGIHALVGEALCPEMTPFADGQGDPAGHRARQLTGGLLQQADLVITMSADHRSYILDEWPEMGLKTFVIGHVAREMRRLPGTVTLDDLVDHLSRHRTAEPDDAVPDPYRRGAAAAAKAAHAIDTHLVPILDGLRTLAARAF